ncbi:MAG: hypothetical protein R3292_06150 [Alcanivorax sp.]|nr:hypothetical protein [Alcanivorax sp.]
MTIRITTLLAAAAFIVPACALAAETPQRGMTQAQVRAQFGAPEKTLPPVGNPPITRWFYNGYTVYFERNLTLYTVVDTPPQSTAPAPDVVSGKQQLPPLEPIDKNQPDGQTAAPTVKPEDTKGMTFDPTTGRFVGGADSASQAKSAKQPAPAQPADSATDAQSTPAAADSEGMTFNPMTGKFVGGGDKQPQAGNTDQPKNEQAPAAAPKAAAPAPKPQPAPAKQPAEKQPAEKQTVSQPDVKPSQSSAPAETAKDASPAAGQAAKDSGEFRFDPVTGRIIISGQESAAANPQSKDTSDGQKAPESTPSNTAGTAESEQKTTSPAASDSKTKTDSTQSNSDDSSQPANTAPATSKEKTQSDGQKGGFYIDWGARQ